MSKYGVISGPYFPVFGLNREIYRVNLEHLWVTSQVISPNGDIEINPGLESRNALNRCFSKFLKIFKKHISAYVYKSFSFISIHFCSQILYYLPLRNLSQSEIPSDDKIWKYLETILSEKITLVTSWSLCLL